MKGAIGKRKQKELRQLQLRFLAIPRVARCAENAAKAAKKAEAIAAREEAKRIPEGWKVEVGPQTYRGRGEGSEIRAEVTVTSPSGMVYRYVAVNIFDAGMGLYRPEGGLAKAGAMGEEVLAIEYALRRIPEGLKAVRM